jgi:hypothetical protein
MTEAVEPATRPQFMSYVASVKAEALGSARRSPGMVDLREREELDELWQEVPAALVEATGCSEPSTASG